MKSTHKTHYRKYSIGDILSILNERIEDMKEENLPMNSVMYGIMMGLIEARDLILEERD